MDINVGDFWFGAHMLKIFICIFYAYLCIIVNNNNLFECIWEMSGWFVPILWI